MYKLVSLNKCVQYHNHPAIKTKSISETSKSFLMFTVGNFLSPNPGPGNQLWEVFFFWFCPWQNTIKWYYSFSLFYLFYSNVLLFLRFILMDTFCSSMLFPLLSSIPKDGCTPVCTLNHPVNGYLNFL